MRRAIDDTKLFDNVATFDDLWKKLMLTPVDYGKEPLHNGNTRILMEKMGFEHGGAKYDALYPEGIPTSMEITLKDGKKLATDIVMFPPGHSRNTTSNLTDILQYKFGIMGRLALEQTQLDSLLTRLNSLETMTNEDLYNMYNIDIKMAATCID